jgi:peptide-methionine (S)-S-oxide reductase
MRRWITPLLGLCLLLPGLLLPVLLRPAPLAAAPTSQEAVFAGGCFWCLEHDLERLPGVLSAESGYSGGQLANPSYRQVSAGGTGHQESVRVRFDPDRISYAALLRAYWRNVDPFDDGGQFCDRGDSYRPVIFTRGAAQSAQARSSAGAVARLLGVAPAALKVRITPLQRFWPAEAYHQDYAERNPIRYGYYRWACGRDQRLRQVWSSGPAGSTGVRSEGSRAR